MANILLYALLFKVIALFVLIISFISLCKDSVLFTPCDHSVLSVLNFETFFEIISGKLFNQKASLNLRNLYRKGIINLVRP